MELLALILSNWETIALAAGAIHTLAIAVVNLTPTQTDNEIVKKVFKTAEVLAGLVTRAARENVVK